MGKREDFEAVFLKLGYTDYKWIKPEQIETAQWVRLKCMFGCDSYGKNSSCPPNVPAVSECREFFNEYSHIAVFHFTVKLENPDDRANWTRTKNGELLKLERDLFLAGYYKAFLLFLDECRMCGSCTGKREECANKKNSRPSPEGMGMDVYKTVRNCGYEINVVKDFSDPMDRFAFLFID